MLDPIVAVYSQAQRRRDAIGLRLGHLHIVGRDWHFAMLESHRRRAVPASVQLVKEDGSMLCAQACQQPLRR
jgi:hypothetical protein